MRQNLNPAGEVVFRVDRRFTAQPQIIFGPMQSSKPQISSLPPVLIVADHFGYPSGVSHGLTTYFLHVLPALRKAGVELTACFLRDPHPAAEELHQHGIEPIFLSTGQLDVSVPVRLAALAKRKRCGIIHASQMKATLAARIAGRLANAQTIVHIHDLAPVNSVVRSLHRLFARPKDLGIAVAHAVRQFAIEEYSIRPDRLRVIHNSVPLDDFRRLAPQTREEVRASLGIGNAVPVIAMVGRMYIEKGHRHMVRIMSEVARTRPDALLLLIGDGPERAACEALAQQLNIAPSIRFLGQRNDVPQLLAACDLVAMPSDTEGLPLAAVEAIAVGRPVVGFDVGGCREVIDDGETGRVIEPGNISAFATAVVELLSDPQTLKQMSAKAYATAERFGLDQHIRALLHCYQEVAQPALAPLAQAR
jgi:glycosyltransferase involved in cell wall biosynthesis